STDVLDAQRGTSHRLAVQVEDAASDRDVFGEAEGRFHFSCWVKDVVPVRRVALGRRDQREPGVGEGLGVEFRALDREPIASLLIARAPDGKVSLLSITGTQGEAGTGHRLAVGAEDAAATEDR